MSNFKDQQFYSKLNDNFSKTVEDLIKKKRIAFIYRTAEWVCWLIALFILLINYNSFYNAAKMKNTVIVLLIAGSLVIIAEKIYEEPKKSYNKAKQKVKDEMLFDICKCSNRCSCRNEFKNYIKENNIDLFKDEE